MNEIKQTHQDFVDEFNLALAAAKPDFESIGLKVDHEDIGETISVIFDYLHTHPTDELVLPFYKRYVSIMADLYWGSPHAKVHNPFEITFSYKGKTMSTSRFGADIYSDVYGRLFARAKGFADTHLISTTTMSKYLEGDNEARNSLMSELDFQQCRNWAIVWAKTDWIAEAFPKSYAKMMEDGQFLSREEVEARMNETPTS